MKIKSIQTTVTHNPTETTIKRPLCLIMDKLGVMCIVLAFYSCFDTTSPFLPQSHL